MTSLTSPKMHLGRKAVASAVLLASLASTGAVHAAERGKVLVALSSAQSLTLRDGKTYPTGYYIDELEAPLHKLIDAGYTPVFANPQGNAVTFDAASDNKMFYGGSDEKRSAAVKYLDNVNALKHPQTFKSILKGGTGEYAGVMIPGGWSPVQDLATDKDLGKILIAFHQAGKPTGIICHGPAALLSTLPDAAAFVKAMKEDKPEEANVLAKGWPYLGYHLTVFSRSEESATEGAKSQLGGYVPYYVADGLAQAGAQVERKALWAVNIVEDRELISGQQPFSSDAFAEAFVSKLNKATVAKA
ncbi:type 1 glutamine amidotransferase domain-containing protein [Klebsiella sp. Ap-873]|nr:type 1 glutamine amidotransferase domain-containing protein [Klebsiella sp. Ap-873]